MSVEHHGSQTAERHEAAAAELEAARREQLEQLSRRPEAATEDDPARRADAAREALRQTKPLPEPEPAAEKTAPARPLALLDHHLNYTQTLASLQRRLSPLSRGFSRVIHAPVIETTSEALERTVARPSITAGATWTALIVGALFYFTARAYGYPLSGSEMLFSFIVGAVIGLLLEALWRLLRPRRR